ncbi:unnamed protein product [Urochloa decumbens]|uniref:RRM domain-containing protein n=1 Tax=Urochloa decumbens TaxID=240449 RepID=A0ABC9F0R9_9POAL
MEAANYSGKLFIGGLSWETNENHLRNYFGRFGEVTAAVIMRDHKTRRSRGFGFVVFSDASVVEHVTMDKHLINGRMVSAKKVVRKDNHSIVSKSNARSIGTSRKIFVGGLPSNVTEADFRRTFELFGVITNVVVIYNRFTKKPRGFGFITYDSEDAVDKALHKSFHEMNGKMVEVKRAVPKEKKAPGHVARSPAGVSQNCATNRSLNGFNQAGYSPSPIGGYGMRVDGRYGLFSGARNGFSCFGPGFGIGMNAQGFISSSNGRQMGSYYNGSSNILVSPIGYPVLNDGSGSMLSSMSWSVWGNGSINYPSNPRNMNALASPGNGGQVSITGGNWGGIPSAHGMGNISSLGSVNLDRGAGCNNLGLLSGSCGRSNSAGTIGEPFSASGNTYEVNNPGTYGSNSVDGGTAWRFASSEVDMPSFGHDLGNINPNIKSDI